MNKKVSNKIVHITTGLRFRGGERQVLWLHLGLLKNGATSILLHRKISCFSKKDIPHAFSYNFVTYIDLIGYLKLFFQLKTVNPDIIHCHDSISFSFISLFNVILQKKVIYTRRAIFPIRKSIFNKWKFKHCDLVIAISQAVAKRCRLFVKKEKKVSIIPDGVKIDVRCPSKEESRKIFQISTKDFVIGTVAYFTSEKNIPLVFKLADSLITEFPGVIILCIGKLTSNAQNSANKYSNITTPGVIDKVEQYYNAFDLYISTSLKEGLGSALLDAVVRDIPSIAIDSGGVQDIFPEDCPYLVSAHDQDSFINIIKDTIGNYQPIKKFAKSVGTGARERFNIDNVVKKHIEEYTRITIDN